MTCRRGRALVGLVARIGRWCQRRTASAFQHLKDRFRRWMNEDPW